MSIDSTAHGLAVKALAGATPGGSPTQLQFNNAGVFGGVAGSSFDGTTVRASAFSAYGGGLITSNCTFGDFALDANTTGIYNTAFGVNALTANTSGLANTAVGYGALQTCITGSYNTAVGHGALANGNGSSNVAIGRAALYTFSGANTVAVGSSALLALTSGTNNIAIGAAAAVQLTTGHDNIVIGQGALAGTTSQNNVAIGAGVMGVMTNGALFGGNQIGIGSAVLSKCTTGYENVIVGSEAGAQLTTGFWNTVLGVQAIEGLTTGWDNTAIGLTALGSLTVGNNNTAIGFNAGTTLLSGSNLAFAPTTATFCTYLGSGTSDASATNHNYMTVIGAQSVGDIDNAIILGRLGTDVVYAGETVLGPNPAANAGGTPARTVATLPAASAALKGARSFVTDATAPTFLGALTGGGMVVCPVFCNGTAWVAAG